MYNIDDYKIIYYYSFDDECFLARIPELDGCISDGEPPKEAINNVRKLAEEWIDIAKEQNWVIPKPTTTVFPIGKQILLMKTIEQPMTFPYSEKYIDERLKEIIDKIASWPKWKVDSMGGDNDDFRQRFNCNSAR